MMVMDMCLCVVSVEQDSCLVTGASCFPDVVKGSEFNTILFNILFLSSPFSLDRSVLIPIPDQVAIGLIEDPPVSMVISSSSVFPLALIHNFGFPSVYVSSSSPIAPFTA